MLIDAQKQQKREAEDQNHENGGLQQGLDVTESDELTGKAKASTGHKQKEGPAAGGGHPPAPDGGWGWVVAAAVALSAALMIIPILSFPFVFADYLQQLGEGAEAMTTIVSVWTCVSSFIGLLCNTLFRRFSFRQIAMMGGLLYGLGNGCIALGTSLVHFLLCSVIMGAGSGLIAPAIFTSINSYFDRKRTFVMGFVQFAIGVGGVGVPVMTQKLVAALGFRTTQFIISALVLLIIPAALPMKPLRYEENDGGADTHSKSADQESGPHVGGEERKGVTGKMVGVDYVNEEANRDSGEQKEASKGSINLDDEERMPADDLVTQREEEKRDLIEKSNNSKEQRRSSSVARVSDALRRPRISIASFNSIPFPEQAMQSTENQSKRWWTVIIDLLDLRLMQDLRFTNVLIGTSLVFFVDMMFMTLLPLYLFHNNLSREESAFCMSVAGVADLLGRFTLVVIGACCVPNNRILFLISAAVSVLLRTMYIFFADYTSVMVLSALLGYSKCFILCVFTLVLGEVCSPDRFPAAFGLQSVFTGLLNVAFGPLLGKLKDLTGSFSSSIWVLTVLGLLCVIPWTLELSVTEIRKRKKKAHV
ncbi:monocarboxylate transporter 9-like [Schistocerca gregaria]|uniref:monocarboxylate transporter 9-like n=1 Tax=Schistocerca gregaria TaxID=7010 RepID=UPI00211E9DEA|nr:monocarboxylate transporter 9-like [Schistocerca gregaria]